MYVFKIAFPLIMMTWIIDDDGNAHDQDDHANNHDDANVDAYDNDDDDDNDDNHDDIDVEMDGDGNDGSLLLAVDEGSDSCHGCSCHSYLLLVGHPPLAGLCVAAKMGRFGTSPI